MSSDVFFIYPLMFWQESDDWSLKKPGVYHSIDSFENHFDNN